MNGKYARLPSWQSDASLVALCDFSLVSFEVKIEHKQVNQCVLRCVIFRRPYPPVCLVNLLSFV